MQQAMNALFLFVHREVEDLKGEGVGVAGGTSYQ